MVLRGPRPQETVVIREGLESGGFPDSEAPALRRVVMDEVVAVLGDMRRDGGGGTVGKLHAEPVRKHLSLPADTDVPVCGQQASREIGQRRAPALDGSEGRGEGIAL